MDYEVEDRSFPWWLLATTVLGLLLIIGLAYWGMGLHDCSTKRFGGASAFSYNGTCYVKYAPQNGADWQTALQTCKSKGGTLASIPFETYWQKMVEHFNLPDNRCYWIGLYSPNKDGQYVWLDGAPIYFVNWAMGEPDSKIKGNEIQSCVIMHSNKKGGLWSDEFCTETYCDGAPVGFICEYKKY